MTSKLIKSEDLGESWELIASFSNKNLCSIHFFNEDSGVVAGWDRIYRTIDSGISWDTVWNPQQIDFKRGEIKQMDFPSNHIGYAVGRGRNNSSTSPFLEGFILKTWNAGQSWDTIKKVPGELISIDFLNNDIGYVGRGSIFKTTDGGESWAEAAIINSPADYYAVNSIHFISQTTGFAVGAPTAFVPEGYTYFIISKTIDGGESWASYRSIGLPLNSVHFLNDSTGFVAGWYNLLMKSNGILDELPENYPMHLADLDGVNVNESALSEFEIQIYPNPTSGALYIQNLNVSNEIKKTVLINTSGQIVKIHKPQDADNQFIKLDLSDLIPGIYMLKIELSGENEIMKIIKK